MEVLDSKHNFLAIESEFSLLENSAIAIVSAPYEHSVSYGGGTAAGPQAILDASAYVEFYDDEFNRELCFEQGIATLKPIEFGSRVDKQALDLIEKQVSRLLEMNKFVVTLGGEHTISIAPIAAHFKKYPDMSILHFDAHSDLRQSYEGSIYSHASFMARVTEFFPFNRVSQVGIRALSREEANLIRLKGVHTYFAQAIRRGRHGDNWQNSLVTGLKEHVYVTFDVDFFDPSIMPSTGTPEPDGFLYNETINIFREMANEGKKIIGFDVVELAPVEGVHHPDLTTARLIYKMLNFAFNKSEI